MHPVNVGRALGDRSPRKSWVVNATTHEPTRYAADQKHPDLYRTDRVIKTAGELRDLLESAAKR